MSVRSCTEQDDAGTGSGPVTQVCVCDAKMLLPLTNLLYVTQEESEV